MEWVGCHLCGEDQPRPLLYSDPWRVVKCGRCGLVYLNPRPTTAERESLYGEDYFTNRSPTGAIFDQDRERGVAGVRELVTMIEQWKPKGRLMDVGCGLGYFLAGARRRGWQVQGVELSSWAARMAREGLGVDVAVGPFESLSLPEASYDVVTMWHFLEHVPHPQLHLRKVGRVLKDDGLGVIACPNVRSFDAWYYGAQWRGWNIPHHLHFFAPLTITQLLRKAGFEVVHIRFTLCEAITQPVKRVWPGGWHGDGEEGSAPGRMYTLVREGVRRTAGRIFTGRDMIVVARKIFSPLGDGV